MGRTIQFLFTIITIVISITTLVIIGLQNDYEYVDQTNKFTYIYRHKETNQLYYTAKECCVFENIEPYLTPIIEEDGTPLFLDEYQEQSILNRNIMR